MWRWSTFLDSFVAPNLIIGSSRSSCHNCRLVVPLNRTSLGFGCDEVRNRASCRFSISGLFNTGFRWKKSTRQQFCQDGIEVSLNTFVDWFNYCRETCSNWVFFSSEKIWREGLIAEIDEAKIGKTKYERRRTFGRIESETKVFIVSLTDQSAPTLLDLTEKWIKMI